MYEILSLAKYGYIWEIGSCLNNCLEPAHIEMNTLYFWGLDKNVDMQISNVIF